MNDLKSLVSFVLNRKNYPNARIGFGSRVIDSTLDAEGVLVGKGCYIHGCKLSTGVIIKDRCTIFNSILEHNTAIYPNTELSKSQIGAFSYLNENSSMGGVTVGRFTSIGPSFICGYGEHPTNFITTSPVFYSTRMQCGVSFTETNRFEEHKETRIGSDVWIGSRVFVKDGVTIGNGALIAAGAVVVADVPDYAVVGGVPAKLIRYRFSEEGIRELLEIQWWLWSEEKLRDAQPLLAQPDIQSFLEWSRR